MMASVRADRFAANERETRWASLLYIKGRFLGFSWLFLAFLGRSRAEPFACRRSLCAWLSRPKTVLRAFSLLKTRCLTSPRGRWWVLNQRGICTRGLPPVSGVRGTRRRALPENVKGKRKVGHSQWFLADRGSHLAPRHLRQNIYLSICSNIWARAWLLPARRSSTLHADSVWLSFAHGGLNKCSLHSEVSLAPRLPPTLPRCPRSWAKGCRVMSPAPPVCVASPGHHTGDAPRPGWAGLAFGATSLALCPAVPPRRPPPAPRAPSLSSCLNSVLLHTEASPAMLRRPSQKSRLLPPSAPASRRPTPGRAARGLHHWPCSLLHAAHGHCPRHTGVVLKCPPLFSTWSSATAFCVECPPSGPS